MSRDPDCPYHVRIHPDEKCTCTPDAQPHAYISTACHHGLHDRCRRTCKFCSVACACPCGHPDVVQSDPSRTGASEPEQRTVVSAWREFLKTADLPQSYESFAAGWLARSVNVRTLEAELLRLNGPTCPFDGRRASEGHVCRCSGRSTSPHVHFGGAYSHPAWPEGEAFLRERAR